MKENVREVLLASTQDIQDMRHTSAKADQTLDTFRDSIEMQAMYTGLIENR